MRKSFSKREVEIIRLICEEETSKSIAPKIGLSKRHIEHIRQQIMRDMGVVSIAGMVVYAIKNNLVDTDNL